MILKKSPLQKAQKALERHGVDGLLVSNPDNVRYLSGFTGSEGTVLISEKEKYLLTDVRYTTQASEEAEGFIVKEYREKEKDIAGLISQMKIRSLGFEPQHMTFQTHNKFLQSLSATRLIPLVEGLDSIREVKENSEVECIKEAVRIASESYMHALEMIQIGVEERKVALEIEYAMRSRGAEKVSFDTIVASGRRAAFPHGIASSKKIEKGDFIVIDYGARYQGYYSDETQTVVVDKPTARQKKIYQVVKDAQEKAFDAIKPGVDVKIVDSAARDYISKAGFGKYFGHGTGHGVGLAVHEMPRISPLGKGRIEEGMVFTVEPGIYIPNWGGVRIEDMVRVSSNGYEKLTFLSKELQMI